MNHIQKAWLRVLSPVSQFVNQKLAKKSGILGRIGRFYAFGPRQFGYHPSSKALKFVNNYIIETMPMFLHKYSFIKTLSPNGHVFLRPHRFIALFGYLCMLGFFVHLVKPQYAEIDEGTDLSSLQRNLGLNLPANALENRLSAHFTEINNYYMHQMAKKYIERTDELTAQRNVLPLEVKKTKYARPGYKFIEPHTKFVQKQ